MKENNKYIFEAVLGGVATCALCAVAIVSFAPKAVDENQYADYIDMTGEEYVIDDYSSGMYFDDEENYADEEVYLDEDVYLDEENFDEVETFDVEEDFIEDTEEYFEETSGESVDYFE